MSKVTEFFKSRFTNIASIKSNFNKIKANPYSAIIFEYKAYKLIVILLAIFIVAQLSYSIFTLTGNSKPMTMLSRGATLLIMCILCFKLYGLVQQKKKIMEQYLANPVVIDNIPEEKKLDVGKEVDELLAKYDENGKLKEVKKDG